MINTFIELYEFLQKYDKKSIIPWIADTQDEWVGKDKQESLLRLFANLGLIKSLNKYKIYDSTDFNNGTIIPYGARGFFYKADGIAHRYLKDSGSHADLVAVREKTILACSSKNTNNEHIGEYDIAKIWKDIYDHYLRENRYDNFVLCLCTRNKDVTQNVISRARKSNKGLVDDIKKYNTVFIDWGDLDDAFKLFKHRYHDIPYDKILNMSRYHLQLKMHQEYTVQKSMQLFEETGTLLWGHIPRSGKSYIIAGLIIEDIKRDTCKKPSNYLVVTTAPSETISQYFAVFNCDQFQNCNIFRLDANYKPELVANNAPNIVIVSKQFLDGKKKIPQLKYNIRFVDESHNGGTTDNAKAIYKKVKAKKTVFVTATYSKPSVAFGINPDHQILWDLEDITLCKNCNADNREKVLAKHDRDVFKPIMDAYSDDEIRETYIMYPDLYLYTDRINATTERAIIEQTKNNSYGYSTESAYLLNKERDAFQNEQAVADLWYRVFGKYSRFGILCDGYAPENILLDRVHAQRNMLHSNPANVEVILAFLPTNNINKVSQLTKSLLEKIIHQKNRYYITCINSKEQFDARTNINNAIAHVREHNKCDPCHYKGVLVLSGKQCSLGVSIRECDIVILMNNSKSFDNVYQMMFRSMTERRGKNAGFVIDLNLYRAVSKVLFEYTNLSMPNMHPKKAITYLLKSRIINLNPDDWQHKDATSFNNMLESLYKIYTSKYDDILQRCLARIKMKSVVLQSDEYALLKALQCNHNSATSQKVSRIIGGDENKEIKVGIEKIAQVLQQDDSNDKQAMENEKNKDEKIFMTIIRHIVPLICLLTVHDSESTTLESMFAIIKNNKVLHDAFMNQTISWFSDKVTNDIIMQVINIYTKYMNNDIQIKESIIIIKELFMQNYENKNELSKLVDEYLIPTANEKQKNAEVSTPHALRQEMLDKIPLTFWQNPDHKVFEPCAGKGGFLVDIIDKFMNGLALCDELKDPHERYKYIVEECLYFADINDTNIWICKLLIDPHNEYDINAYHGDTLKLDMRRTFCIDAFNAVIGNPPYNDDSGNKGGGHKLWDIFMMTAMQQWLLDDGYLCFVHPPLWRKYDHKLYKIMKHYYLLYLEIHNTIDGQKTFGCGTRYDWYVFQKCGANNRVSIIKDEDSIINKIKINEWRFIPNSNFQKLKQIINTENPHNIIHSESKYEGRKLWICKRKSEESMESYKKRCAEGKFIYPVIYALYKKDPPKIDYSTKKCDEFYTPKVMVTGNASHNTMCDYKGEYGLSQWIIGIVDKRENLDKIKTIFSNNEFLKLMNSIKYGKTIDYKIFKLFKKDFWKEFVTHDA